MLKYLRYILQIVCHVNLYDTMSQKYKKSRRFDVFIIVEQKELRRFTQISKPKTNSKKTTLSNA